MPYWKCYYHIVWATKHRQPVILPAYESVIFAIIEKKSMELRCNLLAINSVADHVHAAVNIPPGISVSKWVGGVKGASSHEVNATFEPEDHFQWQESYGVMTFGERRLSQVKQYIANQKERHQDNDTNTHLERIE